MPFTPSTPDPRAVGAQGTPGRYAWTQQIDAAVRELRDAGLAKPSDVEAEIQQRDLISAAEASATYARRAPEADALHAALRDGRNANVLLQGDSTANESNEWFYLTLQALGNDYASHTIRHRGWNDTNQGYDAPVTVQTGTAGEAYLTLPGTAGNYIKAADAAPNRISGAFDLRVLVALDNYTPAAVQTLVGKWDGTQRGWKFCIRTDGTLALDRSYDGTNYATHYSTSPVGEANGAKVWLRCQYEISGASAGTATFYKSTDGVTWTSLGFRLVDWVSSAVHVPTAPLEIGSDGGGFSRNMDGRFYRAELRTGGPTGPLFSSCDVTELGSGLSFWLDGEGNAWQWVGAVTRGGAPGIVAYNASTPGKTISYSTDATRFAKQTSMGAPFLAFINYSHNEGFAVVDYFPGYKGLIDQLKTKFVGTAVVPVLQNPRKSPATSIQEHATRIAQIRQLAAVMRLSVVDGWSQFTDLATQVDSDGIHPTPAGSQAWATAAMDLLGI